jgi:ABC-type multidrug transport system fused ATPase/permease subunit
MWKHLDVLIGEQRRYVIMLCLLSIVSAFAETGVIAILAEVAADIVTPGKKVKHGHHVTTTGAGKSAFFHIHASVPALLYVGFGLTLLRFFLLWPASTLPAKISADVQRATRLRVFRAFTKATWDVQSRDREGTLQENMTSQTAQAVGGALQATGLINTIITFLILMASAIVLSPAAAGIVLVLAVGMFRVLRGMRSLGARRSRELSQALVSYAGSIAEANRLAEESHVFGVREAQFQRVGGFAEVCRGLFYRTQVIARLVPGYYQSLLYLVLMFALFALYHVGTSQPASIGAVILLLFRASQNGQSIQSGYQSLQQSLPFIERLRNEELRYLESAPPEGPLELPSIQTLSFEEVGFHYNPGTPVLTDINFTIDAGETIGIIGPSGAGKSTLVQLLLQLRDPREGRYLVNGTNIKDFKRVDWNRLVSYVPQEPRLLHATVAENIRFYRDIDDESIERAARLARIHDDVVGWSKGYDTLVGPRADAVSGGQQQRICLARALAARPNVLVLDEPTSALDPYSERLIGESLEGLRHELTLVIVAHRMSTLDTCDRVMVIFDGRLMAFDTREYLQENDPYYRSALKIASGTLHGMLPETLYEAQPLGKGV